MDEARIVAGAAEAAQHLDTLVQMFGRYGELSMAPGAPAMRGLSVTLSRLAAALDARADELEAPQPALEARR